MGRGYRRICIAYLLGSSVEAPKIGNLQRALESAHEKVSTKHPAKKDLLAPLLLAPPSFKKPCVSFRPCWGFAAALAFSTRGSGGYSSCGAWASHCGGLSVAEHRLPGVRASGARGRSGCSSHKLSCSAACGILPGQGSNPCLLHGQVDFIHWATREVLSPPYSANAGVRWEATEQRQSRVGPCPLQRVIKLVL